MKLYSILFAIGPDRPGIVEEVSRCLHDNMANIEDSRMAAMGGQFTVTVLFSCMEERMTAIESQAQSLASSGITCYFHTADDPHAQKKGGALPLQIHIQAMDHPGIVKMIVEALHGYGANVESLETRITNAPFSGEPLFNLHLLASIPADQSVARIKKKLDELAEKEYLDLNFPD